MESVFLTAKWIKGGMCVFIKKKKGLWLLFSNWQVEVCISFYILFLLEYGVKCRTLSRI